MIRPRIGKGEQEFLVRPCRPSQRIDVVREMYNVMPQEFVAIDDSKSTTGAAWVYAEHVADTVHCVIPKHNFWFVAAHLHARSRVTESSR